MQDFQILVSNLIFNDVLHKFRISFHLSSSRLHNLPKVQLGAYGVAAVRRHFNWIKFEFISILGELKAIMAREDEAVSRN